MRDGQASRTAFGAARHRAVHQILERGAVFPDPLAIRILGVAGDRLVESRDREDETRRLRLFLAVRSRLAEEAVAQAVSRDDIAQYVVLGAGLDTFACRSPYGGHLRCFEVDHPATQAWKRECLAAARIAVPDHLVFAPVDFETGTLGDGLACAGFDMGRPAVFAWLGVVPYLSRDAIFATLRFIAANRGQVIFDYGTPPGMRDTAGQATSESLAARTRESGEDLRTWFTPDALRGDLRELGFHTAEDFGPAEIAGRFWPDRPRPGGEGGGHVIRASALP